MVPSVAVALTLAVALLREQVTVGAFTIGYHRTGFTTCTRMSMAAKPLATFDASDFALPSGAWPYGAADLNRLDNARDREFYDTPRFVTHIDDRAIESLTAFYREEFATLFEENGGRRLDVLDLCSSWLSHLPTDDAATAMYGKVVGVGMNEEELRANPQLTSYQVRDLNADPRLDADDASYDVVCNVVSVDYLTDPLAVFRETHRVLRPGGRALISFSNRCFPTKAVAMWLQADDIGRLTIVGSYFHYASPDWATIDALDVKLPPQTLPTRPSVRDIFNNPNAAFVWATTAAAVTKNNGGDPLYLVRAVKKS